MENLLNEKINIIKKEGKNYNNIPASVQKNKIYIYDKKNITKDDYIEYKDSIGNNKKLEIERVFIQNNLNGFYHIEIDYHEDTK